MDGYCEQPFIDFITYEDISFTRKNFIQAVSHATGFTDDNYMEIERSDCIEGVLTSVNTFRISALNARQFITFTATDCKPLITYL
jgi:formiminoglutamase